MKKHIISIALLVSVTVWSEAPRRVVSTSGNASEVVADLGLEDQLVAVDTTSLIPREIMEKKPKIGYRRQLSAEGILSMNPDLVILAPDAGPPAVVKQLESSGLNIFYIKDEQTLSGINDDITRLGKALGREKKAAALVSKQEQQAERLEQSISNYPRKPKLVMLLDTGGGVFGLGKNSAGESMIAVLGGELSLDFDGMKPVSKEILASNDADAVLIASRNDADDLSIIKPLTKGIYDALDHHPAAQRGCVFQVNIMRTLGFGPNTAETADEIAKSVTHCIH